MEIKLNGINMFGLKTIALILLVLIIRPQLSLSQSGWNKYKPSSLKKIIEEHYNDIDGTSDYLFSANSFPSIVNVKFNGLYRNISAEKKKFIDGWITALSLDPEYKKLINIEFLFKEGDVEYWLPVQNTLIKHFNRELHKGDTVNLFVVWLGVVRKKKYGKAEMVFLVNEFIK